MSEDNEIYINGVKYIKADSVHTMAHDDGLKYCIVRTYSAGVHIGFIKTLEGKTVVMHQSRRLWRWTGAASLSQVAIDGCHSDKFTVAVPEIILTEAIEVIPCTANAKKILDGIKPWTA